MESDAQSDLLVNGDTNEVVDKFAATLRKSAPEMSNTSPSESFSSEPTNDDVSTYYLTTCVLTQIMWFYK